jgi:hypothetical protein
MTTDFVVPYPDPDMYDYEEECIEPVAPKEALCVKTRRPKEMIEFNFDEMAMDETPLLRAAGYRRRNPNDSGYDFYATTSRKGISPLKASYKKIRPDSTLSKTSSKKS